MLTGREHLKQYERVLGYYRFLNPFWTLYSLIRYTIEQLSQDRSCVAPAAIVTTATQLVSSKQQLLLLPSFLLLAISEKHHVEFPEIGVRREDLEKKNVCCWSGLSLSFSSYCTKKAFEAVTFILFIAESRHSHEPVKHNRRECLIYGFKNVVQHDHAEWKCENGLKSCSGEWRLSLYTTV